MERLGYYRDCVLEQARYPPAHSWSADFSSILAGLSDRINWRRKWARRSGNQAEMGPEAVFPVLRGSIHPSQPS